MRTRRARHPSPDLFTLRCEECGRSMLHTESGYLACPAGHGRLHLDDQADHAQESDTFLCFPDDQE